MMKRLSPAPVIFLLALLPAPLFAKATITRVAIEGNQLTVSITDRSTLAQFNIWSGPGMGSSSSQGQSFIVDWSEGPLGKAPQGVPNYQVSFYGVLPGQKSESLLYVVTYAFDPHTGRGYVYLPGRDDRWYGLNVGTIFRGVEGKWFHAWNAWDSIAGPLIAEKAVAQEEVKKWTNLLCHSQIPGKASSGGFRFDLHCGDHQLHTVEQCGSGFRAGAVAAA